MPWMHGFGFGWGGMIFGGLLTLLFWGVIIALVFFVVRALSRSGSGQASSSASSPGQAPDRALEILRERYARGEISKDEFNSMRQDLTA
jgi:putative membrane protein